jgi:HPt (histidine-containing phosphotransfer) domain-containing protein
MKGDKERCVEAGMDGYVAKLVSSKDIEQAIGRASIPETRVQAASVVKVATSPPPAWNWAKTLEKVGGDEQFLKEVIHIFLEESPKQLAELGQAVREADAELLERVAHSLKGALGYLGLSDACQKARDLERMGRERGFKSAAESLSVFETVVANVSAEMSAFSSMSPWTCSK